MIGFRRLRGSVRRGFVEPVVEGVEGRLRRLAPLLHDADVAPVLLEGQTRQYRRLPLLIVRTPYGTISSDVVLAPMFFDSELSLIDLGLGLLLEVVERRTYSF